MRRFYGLDLADAVYGPNRLSAARLRALIEQLPQQSAYAREQGAWWTPDLELLATIAESIGEVLRVLQGLGGVKQPKNPVKIRRPTIERPATGGEPQQQQPAQHDARRPIRAADYRRAFFNFEARS